MRGRGRRLNFLFISRERNDLAGELELLSSLPTFSSIDNFGEKVESSAMIGRPTLVMFINPRSSEQELTIHRAVEDLSEDEVNILVFLEGEEDGYTNVYGVFLTLKPSNRLRISTEFTKQTFWEEWGGEEVYDYNVLRNRVTYQLSKTLSLRAIVDYSYFYRTVYASFLFSYVYRPGTVFFFGVDNDVFRNDLWNYINDNYSVFVKFSYWHRM